MIPSRWVLPLGALALGLAAGLGVGWRLWRTPPPKPETPAPAIRQADGSLLLKREPQAAPKPAQAVPPGAKVERVVQVEIQPREKDPTPTAAPEILGSGGPLKPHPIRVDLSLFRMPDQTLRVGVSSPDGEVVGGIDIPATPPPRVSKPLKWAAGGVYGVNAWGDKAVGAFVDRDMAFLRVGAEVSRVTLSAPVGGRGAYVDARVKIGIRF